MATQKAQRIGIWIIAIVLTIGTLAGFVAIILQPKNEATDQSRLTALSAEYQNNLDVYQKKVDAQGAQYFDEVNQYSSKPAVFNKDDVTDLKMEDLKIGDGADIASESTFSAYYIGWNPDGKIFDSSIDGTTLKEPILVTPGGVIEGWTEGVSGMKVGGIRELTIPSDKAYGASGGGDLIPADTPLKFIILIVPTIPQAEVPAELLKYYNNGGHF